MNEARGFLKLIKNKNTGKIIGGSVIGADASSLISSLTLGIANGFTDKEITETIFPHPTTSETIHEAALDFGIGALHQ
jgi:dihydrolipoamide dehydrogenase